MRGYNNLVATAVNSWLHRCRHSGRPITFGLGYCKRSDNILGVDFDSKAVTAWHQQGFQARYGDAEDPEFPGTLPLIDAEWVVSTITQLDINLALLDALRHHGYLGKKAMTALTEREAEILKESGADLILSPFVDAAKEATELLAAATVSKVPL